jgi:hypothetical protein
MTCITMRQTITYVFCCLLFLVLIALVYLAVMVKIKNFSNVLGIYLLDKRFSSCYSFCQIVKKERMSYLDMTLTLTYLTHSAGFTIAWIEYVMSFKPIVMMRRMMGMFVSYRMRMTLMVEEMRMLVSCVCIVVACHGPQDIRQLTNYCCELCSRCSSISTCYSFPRLS